MSIELLQVPIFGNRPRTAAPANLARNFSGKDKPVEIGLPCEIKHMRLY